jgi:hypothetical protein
MHPYPFDFFPFFSANSCCFPLSSRLIFGAATTFLLPHFKGSSWLHGPGYGRKEKSHIIL